MILIRLWQKLGLLSLAILALLLNGGEKPQVLDNDPVFVDLIKKECGWDNQGFVTRINEIRPDFISGLEKESDPLKVSWNHQLPFWKETIRRYAKTYEKIQKHSNDQQKIAAAKYRKEIEDLFAKRLELRGGGSVSWEMWMYLPGYVEWILGHIESGKGQPMGDGELLKTWMESHPFDLSPDSSTEKRLTEVITELRRTEAKLPSTQARFLRSEFYRFFLKEIPSSN